mmetsp:Transcript_20958/g.29294  ORF Transcript_20958/g.29294 Transcript_20958/m.29294 type:complete len:1024 (+) Transcript_20958:143-3214(+)|eukprot:CAMPEP_0184484312 /NCGR_PEP_ID=MMETSP0113_2-20130426/6039_1 /TAXON_ID=91329 /ORGANISM="Norrisiella sphaerica, Strain BC52" /LENGTH=1023 /DNA_ID=CAMNT_0026865253 /DNA_START=860 /DNA_END=3931 /DNA_ORIENTATION=+
MDSHDIKSNELRRESKNLVEEGERLYSKKLYTKAVECFTKAADQGHTRAQCYLGYFYYVGHYVKQSYEKAVKWCTKSANQGHAVAQCLLGICFRRGHGVKQSYSEAVKWYTRAADQGDTRAQCELGICYRRGHGVNQSYKEAVKWYTKAADQGDGDAQYSLGWCYRRGRGVKQSYEEAVKWYTKAADQGHSRAQNSLGCCYRRGRGVKQSHEEAAKWFARAAYQGHASAQNNLGHCYELGSGVNQNHEEAVRWFAKAANQGHSRAQSDLERCYVRGHCANEEEESRARQVQNALITACSEGDLSIVERLVASKASLTHSNEEGHSGLLKAVMGGHVSVVNTLLTAKADANQKDRDGLAAIAHVVRALTPERKHVLDCILVHGFNVQVDQADKQFRTPLIVAAERHEVDMCRRLLEHKARVNCTDDEGNTPIIAAATYRLVGTDRENSLSTRIMCLDSTTTDGTTDSKSRDATDDAQKHSERKWRSRERQMESRVKFQLDTIRLLHQQKAVVNTANHDGLSPILLACSASNPSLIRLLICLKADPLARHFRSRKMGIDLWKMSASAQMKEMHRDIESLLSVAPSSERHVQQDQQQNQQQQLRKQSNSPLQNEAKAAGARTTGRMVNKKHASRTTTLDAIRAHRISYPELEIRSQIGIGAFGVVYMASWRNSPVAIKRLHQQHMKEKNLSEFLFEAEIMERVANHPRVVRFLGVCATPGQPLCIVTEFLPGGAVDKLLRSEKTLSLPLRMRWARDCASGVLHLHAERIIHRDIAARNLLVDKNMRVKVTDFGMSRIRGNSYNSNSKDVDTTKSTVGPVRWMAPEAIVHQHYSEKSDTYSFGVTLWELVTRGQPYKGYANLQVALRAYRLLSRQHEMSRGRRSASIAESNTGPNADAKKGAEGTTKDAESEDQKHVGWPELTIPELKISECTNPLIKSLFGECMATDAKSRPNFQAITQKLEVVLETLGRNEDSAKREGRATIPLPDDQSRQRLSGYDNGKFTDGEDFHDNQRPLEWVDDDKNSLS